MEEFSKYVELHKKVKIISGKNQEDLMRKADPILNQLGEKVIDIMQKTDKMMFIFYLEE
jgi:hypothetical protein